MTRAEAIEWLEIATPIRELSTKDYKRFMKAITMAIDSLETDEAYQLEYEKPTTKNDLGVDAVSRKAVLKLQYRIDDSATLSTRDVVNVEDIEDLPSVTPQEPIEPMVEIDLYSVIKQKYIEREVLDKIRAEIRKLDDINPDYPMDRTIHISRNEVLAILDKYKADFEPQESEDKE